MSNVFENPIELLEGMWPTPLLRLGIGKDLWAKLEFYNPFSRSIKDRTAYFLFKEAMKSKPAEIVEASSGNTAIALAALSAIASVRFTAFIPSTAPQSFRTILEILGSEVVEAGTKTTDLIPLVKSYAEKIGAVNVDQFTNRVNPEAHYSTTAKEIASQLSNIGKSPRRVIATMGTGGHIAGIVKFFRPMGVEVIGVQPAVGERIPGIKRQEVENPFIKEYPPSRVVEVTFEEAVEGIRDVARGSGILVGPTAGATVAAFKKLETGKEDTTVLVFPDDVYKYLDEIGQDQT